MRRVVAALYGFVAYLAFLLPIGYLVGFLADAGVPKTVNRGAGPLGPALVVDLGLLLLFGLQHSVMARPGFKRLIERRVPASMERSTYVLASGLVLCLLFWLWRPVPAVLWDVTGTRLGVLARAGYAVGWALAVWATFALSHMHLFGVSQVAAYARGREHPRPVLRRSLLYRMVRHPMTAGLVLAFWSTPRMTLGHLVFAAGMTAYSVLATVLEERDLLRAFADAYRAYRREVPALVPVLRPAWLGRRGGGLALELSAVAVLLGAASGHSLRGARVLEPSDEALPALEHGELVFGSRTRTFAVYEPSGGREPRPVVLALHGTGGSARRLQTFLGGELERAAERAAWLVVYPEAYGGAWNDCRARAASAVRGAGVDDVAFLRALVRHLAAERSADPGRVFVLGYSGGGHMAFRLALETPGFARGVAVFGASLPADDEMACTPSDGTVPVMVVNGTRDPVNPFGGGEVIAPTGTALGRVRSSAETADWFRIRAGGRAEVTHVALENGGHAVPGAASRFPALVGPTVRSWDGVRESMEFFARQEVARGARVRAR